MNAKEGMVLLLTTVFVFLYVLALFGTIRLPSDDKLVAQIAPIITVIIGYYFGRIPGEKNEQTLQQQVNDTGVSGTRRRMSGMTPYSSVIGSRRKSPMRRRR
jgi:hypothetical protein